jgi:hypothetical protein
MFHFLGGILLCQYIVKVWTYEVFWNYIVLFSLLPALLETALFVAIYCVKIVIL